MSSTGRAGWRRALGRGAGALGLLAALALAWVGVEVEEMRTGRRLWPWSAYALCGGSRPAELPAHVLTPSVTARGILNMTALAGVEAQRRSEARG